MFYQSKGHTQGTSVDKKDGNLLEGIRKLSWKKNKQEAKLEALSKESTLVISLHVINLLKRSKLTKAGHRLSLVPDNMRKKMGTLAFCQMAKTRSTLDPPKRHNGHHRGGDNSEGKFRTY